MAKKCPDHVFVMISSGINAIYGNDQRQLQIAVLRDFLLKRLTKHGFCLNVASFGSKHAERPSATLATRRGLLGNEMEFQTPIIISV